MTEDKYEVQSCVPEAAIRVCSTKEPRLTLKITLSSLAMREERSTTEEGTDTHTHTHSSQVCLEACICSFYVTFIRQQRAELKGKKGGRGGIRPESYMDVKENPVTPEP